MKLTSAQRKQVRLSLLRYGLGGFTFDLARQYLRSEGFAGIEKEQVKLEVEYLADPQKAHLRKQEDDISPEEALWKTTAKGRDYLAQQGQDE